MTPVSFELVFWFQAHTEMPRSVSTSAGKISRNSAPAMASAPARSVMRPLRDVFSFPLGHTW